MGDEVLQKARELVSLTKGHVTTHEVLMHHTQVEVVAERVNVHQIPDLIALLGEQHGQLGAKTHMHAVTHTGAGSQHNSRETVWIKGIQFPRGRPQAVAETSSHNL